MESKAAGMLEQLDRVLVVSPHADDESLGCGGMLAKLAGTHCNVHIMYMAVDGFHHFGLPAETSYGQRVEEIEKVAKLFGATYEIAYGDQDLIEKLDTLPRRELVDRFEQAFNTHRPELLLLPSGIDYDQDHVAVFETAFAAARPIAQTFGKWLMPHVMTYEMTKLNWASASPPRPVAYCDISDVMETKLESVRLYESQLRPNPHIRSLESVDALAAIRGKEIGVSRAEAYGVLRTIL